MTDNLNSYGPTFQSKIISALLSDIKFFQTIADILMPDMFDSDANKFLVKIIREYYFEYKILPTLEVLKIKINELEDDILKISVVENLKSAWQNLEAKDLNFVKDEVLKFCKNQVLKTAIIKSVDLLEQHEYDEIKRLVDSAMKAGTARDIGHSYIEGLEQRLLDSERRAIKTPWDPITSIMDGGLGPGELGIVVAPAGIGKCVGGDTKITIQYKQIGFKINSNLTLWFDPWNKIQIDDNFLMRAWEIAILIKGKVKYQKVITKIKLADLFYKVGVDDVENAEFKVPFELKVKTPYGFNKVPHLVRTKKQKSIRIYFENNKSLECSLEHKLKANGTWKQIKNINIKNDIIETDAGTTHIKKICEGSDKILYDMMVDKVYCFYSNGVLSHNTWILQTMGAGAVKQGKTVLHYTLELKENYVGLRYDTIFSRISTANIKYNKDKIEEVIKTLPGNLFIKYYPTKTASVQTIMSHINQVELQGINPDLIIVDYADLLKYSGPSARLRTDEILGNIYAELRGLGGEIDCPVWTACFHGDTVISSPNGKFKIKDKVGKSGFPVFSYDKSSGKMVCKTVKFVYKSGENRELWKVVLDNDKEVIVTSNHKFMLRSGEYKELRDLEVGESLMPFNRKMKDNRKQIYLNNGSWQPQYRMVGEWKFGEIPKHYQIYHKDMNKSNDHSDNLELLTISEYYKIHGRKTWGEHNPCGISHPREVYSERMKLNNPMHNKETCIKVEKSRTGKCIGDDNPMKTLEMKEWFSKNNPQFKGEVGQKTSNTMTEVWKNRNKQEKDEIFNKKILSQKLTYNQKKSVAVELYNDNMDWFEFKKLILHEMKYNEDNLYGLYKKLSEIKVSRKEYEKLYNHKIKSIEFYGYDDVYNMEVEDLHNYALDAGVVVKNSQANRSSLEEDIIEAGKIASSYEKMMIADFVMSISRKAEDKIANVARCHVIKNRFGVDGITYPMKMDTNSGYINIYEGDSLLGKEQQTKMDNREEYLRQQLKQKYNSLKEDKKIEGFE